MKRPNSRLQARSTPNAPRPSLAVERRSEQALKRGRVALGPARLSWLLLFSSVMPLMACTSIPSADLRIAEMGALEGREGNKPIPSRLVMAPATVGFEAPSIEEYSPTELAARADIRSQLSRWIGAAGLFQSVSALELETGESLDDAAWRVGGDMVLETRFLNLQTRFREHHWSYYPNLVNWFMFMIPAWYVASEEYELQLEAEFRLRFADRDLALRVIKASETVVGRFDELDRGWNLAGLGMVFSPALNGGYNWKRIATRLLPAALSQLSQRLVAELEEDFRAFATSADFEQKAARTLAVVVGLGNYADPTLLAPNPEAAEGAKLVAGTLAELHGERAVLRLSDAEATRERLGQAIEKLLVTHSRPRDTAVIYFGTRWISKPGQAPVLALYDDTSSSAGLSLQALSEMLRPVAGKCLIIVDSAPPKDGEALDSGVILQPLIDGGANVFMAAGAGAKVASSGFEFGLFPHHLSEGWRGQADRDRDGRVSVVELGLHVSERVASDSELRGLIQRPLVHTSTRS